MCRYDGTGRLSRLLLALSCVVWLCSASSAAQAQDSGIDSTLPSPLWETLLQLTADLPTAIDDWGLTWKLQVSELQTLNDSLGVSNLSLQISNETLKQLNEDLQISLLASQADLATSESERLRLETALRDSMLYTTQAREEAGRLSNRVTLLTIGCITLGLTTAAGAVYVVGDRLQWW